MQPPGAFQMHYITTICIIRLHAPVASHVKHIVENVHPVMLCRSFLILSDRGDKKNARAADVLCSVSPRHCAGRT